MEFGKAFDKDLVKVMLAHNCIQLDFNIGICFAEVLNLLAQSVETNGLAAAFPSNFHVGLVIQRIDGNANLRNQMRERADVFEMAAVGDDGDFHLIIVRCFHNIPQAFRGHNRLATDDVQADSKNTLTAKMLTNVRKYFLHIVRIAPNFNRLVPLGKAEFAVIVTGFGDVPVDDDEFFDIHKFSSQDCGEWLGDDDAGLDEERANVTVVVAPEVREGAWIALCGGNDKAFFGPLCQVAQDYVLCMPSQGPSAAF
jgi:hypothetical protein